MDVYMNDCAAIAAARTNKQTMFGMTKTSSENLYKMTKESAMYAFVAFI